MLITLAHLIGTEELAGYGFFCDGLFPTLTFKTLTKNLTAGHGVFSTTCPAAGHIDTAFKKISTAIPSSSSEISTAVEKAT